MQGNVRTSLFRPELLKRIVIYGLLILVLGSAQCSFFPILKICPMTPDIIMGMLLAITLIDSPKSAAVTALAAGCFLDAVGAGAITVAPIVYLLFVIFISLFSHKMLTGFASYAILLLPMLLYRALATAVCITLADRALTPIGEIWGVILPEMITTALLCLPIYFLVRLCTVPLETHGKFTF